MKSGPCSTNSWVADSIPRIGIIAHKSMINFGKVIRKFRKGSGLTQRELAKKVKVTPTYISKLESGLANPSFALLKRIARAMRIPPEVVFWEAVEVPARMSSSDLQVYSLAKRILRQWHKESALVAKGTQDRRIGGAGHR